MFVFDFDSFKISPNLALFDPDNNASSSCFLQIRQSPRHSQSPRYSQPQSPRHSQLAQLSQLNWVVPFVDISRKDFESLLILQSPLGSKRKLLEDPPTDNKRNKEVIRPDKLQSWKSIKINSKSNSKTAYKKRSKT